jgi:hypothetical protein
VLLFEDHLVPFERFPQIGLIIFRGNCDDHPSAAQFEQPLLKRPERFAWTVVKKVNSISTVLAHDPAPQRIVGINYSNLGSAPARQPQHASNISTDSIEQSLAIRNPRRCE